MRAKSVLLRLLLSSILSVGLWVLGQRALAGAVRGVAVAAAHLSGERVFPLEDDDRLALVVGPTPGGSAGQNRIFGVSLLRWHVNVIAVPILAMMLGRAPLFHRFLIAGLALAFTVALDGGMVFVYLWLNVRRMRGAPLVSAAIDDQIAYGIAVFGVKTLPVLVWAAVYGLLHIQGPADLPLNFKAPSR
jgi:hypothetical protein